MSNFYITGLPRSRTTWLAMVFNAHGFFCWHEAMNNCEDKSHYVAKMTFMNVVGNADCGIPYSDVQYLIPGPTVIIERNPKDVQRSLAAIGLPINDETLDKRVLALSKVEGLRIAYDKIDERIDDIMKYCVGVPSNPTIMMVLRNIKAEPLVIENNSPCWEI